MPCPNPINCPGIDRPVINLTAELPDEIKFFGYGFFTNGASRYCEAQTQEAANICAAVPEPDIPGPGTNPPPPVVYISNAVQCVVNCGATTERYTAAAGSAVGLSQAAADAAALVFACQMANLLCNQTVSPFTNSPQTCSITCSNGQVVSFTTPSGVVAGVTQLAADSDAYIFACSVAALLCTDLPPVSGGGGPGAGGAGQPPPPTVTPLWSNGPQTCQVACPGGGTTSFTAQAGLFLATSLTAANAIAASYACTRANQIQACIGDIETTACDGDAYLQVLAVSGLVEPITWSISSGSLPAGLALADDVISGVPTTGGSSTFTVGVTGISSATGDPVSVVRSFTIKVIEITTPTALTNGDIDDPYEEALAATGYTGTPVWSLVSGALPAGVTLHPVTGVISGTPTESGDFAFVIGIEDSDAHFCTKAFTLEIEAVALTPLAWWTMTEAAGDRVDVINGAIISEVTTGGSIALAAGQVASAVRFAASNGNSCGLATTPFGDVKLATSGNGVEVTGWLIFDAAVSGDGFQVYYDGASKTHMRLGFIVATGQWQFFCAGDGFPTEFVLLGGVTTATAYFFRMYFNPATGKFGFQIDDGALNESVGVYTLSAQADGRVQLANTTSGPGETLTTRVSELNVFDSSLTAEQIALLWNGGAGTTWPL
jgi:hypothetical protein